MSIELDPPELGFQRPFTREVVQTLHIRNFNHDPVAFKVKTTAPKQYCVRPNSGRIESGREVEVQVLLQAMKEDPPPDYKCRDKFLVQSVLITADREASNVQAIWSQMEKTNKSAITEKKIRVVFLQQNEEIGARSQYDSSPPPYTDPSSLPSVSLPSPPIPAEPTAKPRSKFVTHHNEEDTIRDPSMAGAGLLSLQKQLADAKERIVRLEAELKDQAPREPSPLGAAVDTKERITAGAAGMGLITQPPDGIPVQICAALCLAAFLIAWFFF